MSALVDRLIDHLELHHAAFLAAVAAVPRDMHDVPPAGGGWTVAQIVQHVALIHGAFTKMLARAIESAAWSDNEPDPDRIINGRRIQAALDRSAKVESKDMFIPVEPMSSKEALTKLETAFSDMVSVVRTAEGKALSDIKYPHYVLGELDMWQWIAFAGTHEARHAMQVNDIAKELGCAPRA
jgi:hypothetical protein